MDKKINGGPLPKDIIAPGGDDRMPGPGNFVSQPPDRTFPAFITGSALETGNYGDLPVNNFTRHTFNSP
jgi:hypothetical protein